MNDTQIIRDIFYKVTNSKFINEAILFIENTNGDFSFDIGYGDRNLDSPMFTASIGKLFTATCILILEKENKLSLKDPLNKYFDKSILEGLHIFKGTDYSNQLTISNLLYQTSGIPDWLENGRDKKVFIDNDLFLSFEEKIESIRGDKPFFAPGTRTRYSDTNFCMLGKIIEVIIKKPMAQVCDEWIFKPLNFTKTYLPTSKEDSITHIYYKDKSLYRPNAMMAASGSGDGMTTARELMVFIKAFFNGTFFPKKTFERLSKYGRLGVLTMGGAWYGGGYMRIPLGVPRTLFMGKGELLGHTGATGSFAFYYPEKDLYFVGDFNQAAKPGLPIMTVINLAVKLFP